MLNILWGSFFIIAFLIAIYQSFIEGNYGIWNKLVNSAFSSSQNAFNIALSLTGLLCFWLGLLKIAEKSGIINVVAKILRPLFQKIMPEVPSDSPALGSVIMNISANVLGLDNAATPMGLKAMEQLQELNPNKTKASPAQILFMVINASSVTLIPITILMYRMQFGSVNPSAVFIPILLATSVSTLVGFFSVAWALRLNIFNRIVMGYLLLFCAFIAGCAIYFNELPAEKRLEISSAVGNGILFSIIAVFIISGFYKRLNVYETFVSGAKEGFDVAVRIIPYLVAMLVAIAVFRASGALDLIVNGCAALFEKIGWNTDFVAALPTAVIKPLSGSGARAMMLETFSHYGVDSFPAFVASVIQGSTETTFYVLAVYFGAVKITKVGAALPCALLADFAGICTAIWLSYLFY